MHRNPQSFGEREQFVIGQHPLAAFDLGDLRLVHIEPHARESAGHVFLRDFRLGRDPQALDILAGDVASFAFGTQGALEGAAILLLFASGIILYQNKNAVVIVPERNTPLAILCVDDHTLVGDALMKVFGTAGYAVERAADGESAWGMLADNPARFDVIVTDHEMPNLDGLGLVRRLREARFLGRVIVYSGSLTDSVVAQYRALAVDAIVAKGPAAARLLAVVQAFNAQS